MLDRVEFRTVRRKGKQTEPGGDPQRDGPMPSRPVQQHQAIVPWEIGDGLGQENGHRFGIDPGENQGRELAAVRTHGNPPVSVFADDLLADARPVRPRGPAAVLVTKPPEAGLVLKQ